MKKTVLAIGLVLALSLSVAAASFEFYGGGSYNTFSPDVLNDVVGEYNDYLDDLKAEIVDLDLTGDPAVENKAEKDLTKVDKFESGFGAFGGLRYWINPSTALGGEVEYFSKKNEGSLEFSKWSSLEADSEFTNASGSVDVSMDVSVTGFSGSGAFKASPELTVFASAGYYYLNGSEEIKVAVDAFDETAPATKDLILARLSVPGKAEFSDSALGFKAGAAFSYPVADELSILGRAAFRSLNFKDVEYDKDSDWTVWPVTGDATKADLDFSGFELGLGIVYSF
ncbi:MAG: hypothetical protein ACOYCE_01545 [Limnochordia bacterium]|jgi:hypothetical protein